MNDDILVSAFERALASSEETNRALRDLLVQHKKKYHPFEPTYEGTCKRCGVHQGRHP